MNQERHEQNILVALPLRTWHARLGVEYDREVPLVEEMVLRLILAGAQQEARITALLGFDHPGIVEDALVRLLGRLLVVLTDAGFEVTEYGVEVLERASTRAIDQVDAEIFRDPYTGTLSWEPEGTLFRADRHFRRLGVWTLPTLGSWGERDFQQGHAAVQRLVELDGLPHEKDEVTSRMRERNRQVVTLTPLRQRTIYRLASLTIMYRLGERRLSWRLRQSGGAHASSEALAELESRGALDVLPLERPCGEEASAFYAVRTAVEQGRDDFELLEGDPRVAWQRALARAETRVLLVGSLLHMGKPDEELLRTLSDVLERRPSLRATVVVVDEPFVLRRLADPAEGPRTVRQALQELAVHHAGRLTVAEGGGSLIRLLVCDARLLYVTQLEFWQDDARDFSGVRHELALELLQRQRLQEWTERLLTALQVGTEVNRPPVKVT